ncbi:MAG: polysaccharide deacetylase family protein [Gammaproteobacteria bacterium AqS3]|nr:polysaccharide deacetylase family protein [Gammaproteobacteria bacterium AqS3]
MSGQDEGGLPEEFLRYPRRGYGMDHDWYEWSMLHERAPVSWPGGEALALMLVVPLEWFPLDSSNKPFRPPGGMLTPYPDLRHYTSRDYGNRVGVVRLLDLFAELNVRATFAVNAEVARRYPELIDAVRSGRHEICAHGIDMAHLHSGELPIETEREWIGRALDMLREALDSPPRGWLSPGRSESANTLELLAGAGLEYCLDWVNDDMPYPLLGGRLTAMPHSDELSDRQIILDYRHTEESFVEQIGDAARCLAAETGRFGGRILPLSVSPWVSGLPYRIDYLRRALDGVLKAHSVWSAGAGEICRHWCGQSGQGNAS